MSTENAALDKRATDRAEYDEAVRIIVWLRGRGIVAHQRGNVARARAIAVACMGLESHFLLPDPVVDPVAADLPVPDAPYQEELDGRVEKLTASANAEPGVRVLPFETFLKLCNVMQERMKTEDPGDAKRVAAEVIADVVKP